MVNHPNRSVAYPEPPVPAGYSAGGWLSFGQLVASAHMLGLNKTFDMGENFEVSERLNRMIDAGRVQKWKRGPHQQSSALYRLVWK
jgi:hypothetical protein